MTKHPLKITTETVIRRVDATLTSLLGNGTVVMNMDDASYHELNLTGTRLWALLDEPIVVSELCNTLTTEFAVSEEQCLQDIYRFVENAMTQDLVEIVEQINE